MRDTVDVRVSRAQIEQALKDLNAPKFGVGNVVRIPSWETTFGNTPPRQYIVAGSDVKQLVLERYPQEDPTNKVVLIGAHNGGCYIVAENLIELVREVI